MTAFPTSPHSLLTATLAVGETGPAFAPAGERFSDTLVRAETAVSTGDHQTAARLLPVIQERHIDVLGERNALGDNATGSDAHPANCKLRVMATLAEQRRIRALEEALTQ